jgi:hypothetical protein
VLSDPSGPLEDALTVVQARYDQPDVPTAEKLPARRYVGHGQPGQIAADEDEPLHPKGSLMVSMVRLDTTSQPTLGLPSSTLGASVVHSIVYQVRLLRAVAMLGPGTDPPKASLVTAQSLVLVRDAARLNDALHAWADALPPWMQVALGPVEPQGPSGGLAGNRVTATLNPL